MTNYPPSEPQTLDLGILAYGHAALSIDQCKDVRKSADSRFGLSPLLLKHSDEQALAALVAVFQAIEQSPLPSDHFADWAIVSCARFLGRAAFARVLEKFKTDGAWGVSVHVIPHCTAHGVAGTVSMAIKNHGPSIGIGGGQDSEDNALLAMASIFESGACPGAWMVLSGWSPELQIAECGAPISDSKCHAIALAISPQELGASLGQLQICGISATNAALAADDRTSPERQYVGLFDFLIDSYFGNTWMSSSSAPLQVRLRFAEALRPTFNPRWLRADQAQQDLTGHPRAPLHWPTAARPVNPLQDSATHD